MPEPKSGMGHDFEQQWGIIMAGGQAVQNFTDYQVHVKDFSMGILPSKIPNPIPSSRKSSTKLTFELCITIRQAGMALVISTVSWLYWGNILVGKIFSGFANGLVILTI